MFILLNRRYTFVYQVNRFPDSIVLYVEEFKTCVLNNYKYIAIT